LTANFSEMILTNEGSNKGKELSHNENVIEQKHVDEEIKLKYLSNVYNENISNSSIFEDLDIIYRNSNISLPLSAIPCRVFAYLWDCEEYWKKNCVNKRHTPGDDLVLIAERQGVHKQFVKDNEWTEVTRFGMKEGLQQGFEYGCFFHVRKGTGVFVNVKKTLVLQDHREAKKVFGIGAFKRRAGYCPFAKKLGYDSIQILNSIDHKSNEVIICTGVCETKPIETACVPGLEFRTGLNHDKECICDDSQSLLNCGNVISPKRRTAHLCDQKWF